MVKLLPLLSAALPSLSVKTDDPQVLLQMANVHRHGGMSTEHLHNGVHAMETRVEAMLSEAVASGKPPTKLTDAAYNTMLAALTDIESQLDKEKTANENAWSDANKEVMACATTMKTMLETDPEGANPLKQAWEVAQGDHEACRDGPSSGGEDSEDTVNGKEKQAHTHMTNTAKSAKTAKPECLKSDEEGETSLDKAKRVLAALELAAQWAENHETNVETANSDYTNKRDAAIKKANECDEDQSEFEKAFCVYEVSVKTICSNRDSCVQTNKELRDEKKKQLKSKVAAEKLILQSCSKVRCYLKLIKGERNAAGNLNSDAYTITPTEYNKCKADGTYDAESGTWDAQGPDKKLNICVTRDAEATCEDEPDTCDLTVVATTPDNSNGKSGAWYDEYYKKLEPDETWMDERVGLKDIMKCHHHLAMPKVQGWRIQSDTTSSGWAWDVHRLKFIADGVELKDGCKPVDSGSVDVKYSSWRLYTPDHAFKDSQTPWGGRKNPKTDDFSLGLECAAPGAVEVRLHQGCSHMSTNVKIQKKVEGTWVDAGVSNPACGKEVVIFSNEKK